MSRLITGCGIYVVQIDLVRFYPRTHSGPERVEYPVKFRVERNGARRNYGGYAIEGYRSRTVGRRQTGISKSGGRGVAQIPTVLRTGVA